MSNLRLVGLSIEAFAAWFDFDDAERARRHARRVVADSDLGYLCRVGLADAEVRDGSRTAPVIERMLDRADVAFVHLHNAERGCFSCRAERA